MLLNTVAPREVPNDAMGRLKKFFNIEDDDQPPATEKNETADDKEEKVGNRLSPKVILTRLKFPLNGSINLSDEGDSTTDPGNSKDEDGAVDTSERDPEPEQLELEQLPPTPKDHSTILIQKVPMGTVVQKLPAGAMVSAIPAGSVIAGNIPQVIKNLPTGTIIHVAKTLKSPKAPEGAKKENSESVSKMLMESHKSDNEAPNKTESRDIEADTVVKVRKKRGAPKKPPYVPKRKYKKRQPISSDSESWSPVRISARLKNRKEKFSALKMLRGTGPYANYLLPKKTKSRVPSEERPADKKKRVIKRVVVSHKYDDKPKVNKINMVLPMELGPEITVTRVKNSRAEAEQSQSPMRESDDSRLAKKKSASKVTQTQDVTKSKDYKSDWTVGVSASKSKLTEESSTEATKSKLQKKMMKAPVEPALPIGRSSPLPSPAEVLSRGKKTAKVTPLTQVKGGGQKVETATSPLKATVPSKRPFDEDDFEKYFITKRRICEHNDSLDSDSEEDEGGQPFHFVNFSNGDDKTLHPPPPSNRLTTDKDSSTFTTIYDLVQSISLELPSWNLHVLEDTDSFCIAHVVRGPAGIPVMKKIIEIDGEYNVKVYIDQSLRNEYQGVYNSYESIRNLILTLDTL
ncbi:hypothetical protein AAG570_002233 [Ranatra chinensis]|uniref:Uncharacterized protein n=1 Tax=Ranatra chinensis TaxID=642074 RepID=A0ABD0Y6X2_9HEMI